MFIFLFSSVFFLRLFGLAFAYGVALFFLLVLYSSNVSYLSLLFLCLHHRAESLTSPWDI